MSNIMPDVNTKVTRAQFITLSLVGLIGLLLWSPLTASKEKIG